MRKYEVVAQCYVPVGPGFKYKKPGQVVTLDDDAAKDLGALVKPVKGGRKSTPRPEVKSGVAGPTGTVLDGIISLPEARQLCAEEVTTDAGEPGAAVQRAVPEAVE